MHPHSYILYTHTRVFCITVKGIHFLFRYLENLGHSARNQHNKPSKHLLFGVFSADIQNSVFCEYYWLWKMSSYPLCLLKYSSAFDSNAGVAPFTLLR